VERALYPEGRLPGLGAAGAVQSTEEVTKAVQAAAKVAAQAGQTIGALAETLEDASQVEKQNLAAVRQSEQAAQNLNAPGTHLAELSSK
jgi:methyl-accepting chemotaxis protein